MITEGKELGAQNHENLGGDFLSELRFPKIVCDIVRGHVNAKRYLVIKDSEYHDREYPRYNMDRSEVKTDREKCAQFLIFVLSGSCLALRRIRLPRLIPYIR